MESEETPMLPCAQLGINAVEKYPIEDREEIDPARKDRPGDSEGAAFYKGND